MTEKVKEKNREKVNEKLKTGKCADTLFKPETAAENTQLFTFSFSDI